MKCCSAMTGLLCSFLMILITHSSSAVDYEKCMDRFMNDTGDLDQDRFQGYWYAAYSFTPYRPWLQARNAQFIYRYESNSTLGTWYIADGLSVFDGYCYRRVLEVPETSKGSTFFKEHLHFHNIIDTDYDNYAVVLACPSITFFGKCDYHNIRTLILSRTTDDLQKSQVWSKVTTSASDCADLASLVKTSKDVCLCPDLKKLSIGFGRVCEEK